MAGPSDTYIGYGQGWANVSNTPFREYKHWVHEGGISTPLIVHWPAGIDQTGDLVREPAHLIDIMATCVDLAGAAYPNHRNGQPIKPMEGLSLVPAFAGESLGRRTLFWEHEGNRAIREGDWKLVAKGKEGDWELYNLADDRSELRNLASKYPDRVNELAAQWQAYAERANVLPLDP
jgi:arylsulfatase